MQWQLNEMGLGGEAPPQQYPDHTGQDGGQGWRSIQTADGQVSNLNLDLDPDPPTVIVRKGGSGSAYSY
jgi:hypothetical protein